MEHVRTFYETWPELMKGMGKQCGDMCQGFAGLFQKTMGAGALEVKTKELIALSVAMYARCKPCIFLHVEKCLKAGATREEILESANVAVMMGGGPVFTHMPELIKALDVKEGG